MSENNVVPLPVTNETFMRELLKVAREYVEAINKSTQRSDEKQLWDAIVQQGSYPGGIGIVAAAELATKIIEARRAFFNKIETSL